MKEENKKRQHYQRMDQKKFGRISEGLAKEKEINIQQRILEFEWMTQADETEFIDDEQEAEIVKKRELVISQTAQKEPIWISYELCCNLLNKGIPATKLNYSNEES